MIASQFAVLASARPPDSRHPDSESCRRELRLAETLNVPVVTPDSRHDARYLIGYNEVGRLELRYCKDSAAGPFQVNLSSRRHSKGKDPLLRAIGSGCREIVDGTAGLGVDAAHLAAAGHRITAVEEHPLPHALLQDGLLHCDDTELASRLNLVRANTIEWLGNLDHGVDVVYLDPMYPPRPGSALSRKGIRLLQEIIPYCPDRDRQMLEVARCRAVRRVVVKRPHHAEPLLPGKSGETKGKLVRFDIYPPIPSAIF